MNFDSHCDLHDTKRNTKGDEIDMKQHVYDSHPDKVQEFLDDGFEVTPVDPFGGYVAQNKTMDKNLVKAQATIKRRFQLDD